MQISGSGRGMVGGRHGQRNYGHAGRSTQVARGRGDRNHRPEECEE